MPLMSNNKILYEVAEKLRGPNPNRKLIGKLLYLTNTKSYVSFILHILSILIPESTTHHQQAVQHILRYIKANPAHGLFFLC